MNLSTRSPATDLQIIEADLSCAEHQRAVVDLINAYACDPMGQGLPLPENVREELIPALRRHPTTLIFLAHRGDTPVGIAVCFLGFSTFSARPLVNVHDLAVMPGQRGGGIGQALLGAVESKARQLGCCKVTLEVQENNRTARRAYETAGFSQSLAETEAGGSLFMSKRL